jgi:predicted ATPase
MARLDQLATAKVVAQLGATLGRQFAYDLLRAVSPLDEATLQRGLRQLVDAELLYQRGVLPQATYLFKHALIQEAAYQSLLKSTRQHYHRRIAQVLEAQFPETAEAQPELLAHHYTEAGRSAQAVVYWQQAGQRARARSANTEAIAHLTKGLEVLMLLPDTPEHTQHELELQLARGSALMDTKGYAAPEVAQAFARARALCQQVEDSRQLYPVLHGLGVFYIVRGELQTARELGEQLLGLAQSLHDPVFLVEAYRLLGEALFFLAHFATARTYFEQGLALCDPQQHRSHPFFSRFAPRLACLFMPALALWVLGYPDQALTRSHEGLTLARALSHPFGLAYALARLSYLWIAV